MNFDEMKKRYQNDPIFNRAVKLFYSLLYEGHLNVSELKDAAMFAGFKFEEENVSPLRIGPSEGTGGV